jgi:hypothetical protein
MEFVYVYRDENGEITGSATHAENGEKMSTDNPEYVAWLNRVYPPVWSQIRRRRDDLLTESDWTAIPDSDPKPSKETWLTYRQALRDLPQTFSAPEEVVWPNKPE